MITQLMNDPAFAYMMGVITGLAIGGLIYGYAWKQYLDRQASQRG